LLLVTVIATTAPGTTAPVGAASHATGAVATGLDFLLLGRIVGPARRQLGGLDFLAWTGTAAGIGRASAACRLVAILGGNRLLGIRSDRAAFLGSSGFLATSTFLGAAIMARMASASARALRRRSSRSLARLASSAALAWDSASALARASAWAAARAAAPAACSRFSSSFAALASATLATSAAA
jgi:hypothetical protein